MEKTFIQVDALPPAPSYSKTLSNNDLRLLPPLHHPPRPLEATSRDNRWQQQHTQWGASSSSRKKSSSTLDVRTSDYQRQQLLLHEQMLLQQQLHLQQRRQQQQPSPVYSNVAFGDLSGTTIKPLTAIPPAPAGMMSALGRRAMTDLMY